MNITRDDFPDETPIKTIEVDDEWGLKLGLTSKVFVPMNQRSEAYPYGTQLYRKGDFIYIQDVEVWESERRKGHFTKLLKNLWDLGFTIKVPNPVKRMYERLKRDGFAEIEEREPQPECLPGSLQVVMVKEPPARDAQSS